jgi:hypothetical protein
MENRIHGHVYNIMPRRDFVPHLVYTSDYGPDFYDLNVYNDHLMLIFDIDVMCILP